MTLKRWLPLQEHYIADRMMESSSAAYHNKKAHEALKKAHDGMYEAHQPDPKLGD